MLVCGNGDNARIATLRSKRSQSVILVVSCSLTFIACGLCLVPSLTMCLFPAWFQTMSSIPVSPPAPNTSVEELKRAWSRLFPLISAVAGLLERNIRDSADIVLADAVATLRQAVKSGGAARDRIPLSQSRELIRMFREEPQIFVASGKATDVVVALSKLQPSLFADFDTISDLVAHTQRDGIDPPSTVAALNFRANLMIVLCNAVEFLVEVYHVQFLASAE